MDQIELDKLACIFEMNGNIQAAVVRVEGMKAQNAFDESIDKSPTHGHMDFEREAGNIHLYSQYLRAMQLDKLGDPTGKDKT